MAKTTLPVTTEKLINGGQALATLPDGKKCFIWGALDNEEVEIEISKNKKDWCEAVTTKVINPSPDRITPVDPQSYLSTSPWQIMQYDHEKSIKNGILSELYERAKINVSWSDFYQPTDDLHYRNKMEYNFWFDKETQKVSLALHERGTHKKLIITDCSIASGFINSAGMELINFINKNEIPARSLKSVIIRSTEIGEVYLSLFLKDKSLLDKMNGLEDLFDGLEILFSNPKSPASVATELLQTSGKNQMLDLLRGNKFFYTTRSFFQVNLEPYEHALEDIASQITDQDTDIIDFYCGVGSIGLSVAKNKKLKLVDSDDESISIAKINAVSMKMVEVINAKSELALDLITNSSTVILDPPRAGLHLSVVDKLIEEMPNKIIYLSCNPSTQARDAKLLVDAGYKISFGRGYNFFPRTPHIESLLVFTNVQ
jgi:23S rRNA (uracil1939-C5)-methyltransferase